MKHLRPASEAEVIAEFLRNEFHHRDFDSDRERFAALVREAELSDQAQNAIRRALFYRRRGHMWNQIPRGTLWSLVRLEPADLDRLCVLARTHWKKIAAGNYLLRNVAEQIRARDFHGTRVIGGTAGGGIEISDVGEHVDGMRAFGQDLSRRDDSAVVLIGVDDFQPVTILEGNHRLTAALLVSPQLLSTQFRVYFGASPQMAACCWYRTNLPNMVRYARNRLRYFGNPGADLERVLPARCGGHSVSSPVRAGKAIPQTK